LKGSSDYSEISTLLGELIAIESVNMDYKGSTNGEAKISDYVYKYLKTLGVNCAKEEVLPNRHNVICYIEGKDKRGICFESHMDTVSINNMTIEPLNPVIKEGKMFGRGSADCKGSLAAMMYAIKILIKNNLKPSTNLYFVASVDEEYNHRGVDHFLKKGINLQGAVVGEPTQLDAITACKGVVRWEISTNGKAGHSSRPEKGQNAIYDMMDLIYTIKNDLIPSYQNIEHHLLGSPTMSVGCINGGTAVNIIPDRCSIEVDRRLLPGETSDSAKREILELINKLKEKNKILDIDISDPTAETIPMDTNINEKIVKASMESCKKITGKSKMKGVCFGCDASSFTGAGIPSIVSGPGDILQAHTENEFIDLKEVCQAAEIYSQTCIDF
jgi:succinyl-diaminopimelate desuccinylase